MDCSEESFDVLIQKSYDFEGVRYDGNPQWMLLKELYEKNYVTNEGRNYNNLPKKIHQIWLGGGLPVEYRAYTETWKILNPDWEYKLWMDGDVGSVDIPNRTLFNSIRNLGQKSDFLRYHVLNQFGGIYADTDFECLKSFNNLSYVDFFVGIGFPRNVELYIGLLGSIPHHPIMESIVTKMSSIRDVGWREVFETTGTYFFTRIFFEIVRNYQKGIVPLPTDYFYPFPNQWGHEHRNGRDYIKPCSYAVHHWCVSWAKKH